MSEYIHSRWCDKGMLFLDAYNCVANLYELLGIYVTYTHSRSKDSFKKYYMSNVNTHPFHFRNIGENKIKKELLSKDIFVTRREIRLLSKTYKNIPVYSSSNMGIILTELVNYIFGIKAMKNILTTSKTVFLPSDFLYFQYSLVSQYVRIKGCAISLKKHKLFKSVLKEWEDNIIFRQ